MKIKLRKILISVLIPTFVITVFAPVGAMAAGASLFLSPPSGTKYVGDKFNVLVYVSTTQASNTYDVYLSVSNLTVTGISVGGSICILHPTPPSFNNISAHFRCGLPTPGYTGSGGYIGSISVKGNSPGTAKVFVDSNSQVLANDGAGTNILQSRGTATFTIQPQPTAAPSVASTTHPDQDKWYKNKTAILNWSGAGTSFSYQIDQNPDTIPDQTSEGSDTTKSFGDLTDGTWYFHIIVKGTNGTWSSPTHYRLQIDTTPPEKFTPEADPKQNAEKRPIIAFNTTDKTSGIDHYELRIDGGKWETVANPYQIPKITSGNHKVEVKAVDKAGNETVGSVDISIKEIKPPIITRPEDGSVFTYGSEILITGKSFANYQVKIFLDGKEIATVKTDKNGEFRYVYKDLLRSGKHEVYAIAVNQDGIESPKSELVTFNLDPQAYILLGRTVPGIFLITTLIFIIITVLTFILFILLGGKRFRKKIKKILEELEEKVEEDLEKDKVSKQTQEKVEEEFEEAEKELEEK
jgi:hypothetical protein